MTLVQVESFEFRIGQNTAERSRDEARERERERERERARERGSKRPLVSLVWCILSKGPKRLTLYPQVLWATEYRLWATKSHVVCWRAMGWEDGL